MSLSVLTQGLAWYAFGYFIAYHLAYFILHILAVFRIHDLEQSKILTDLPYLHSELEPPVSVLLAAHGDTARLVQAARNLLHLDYSKFEVIIVNDGTDTDSMQAFIAAFDLHPFPQTYRMQLKTQVVKCIYRSTRYPHLSVIDKEYGGRADALNAGINASRYPLFCNVEVGTQVRRDSLQHLVAPFLNDNRVIASVAAARASQQAASLPRSWAALLHIMENLRTGLFAPLGWSMLNGMLIAPAGMALLRKETVIAAGGYSRGVLHTGMELIVRLHRTLRQKQTNYQIRLIAEPVCWQQLPETLSDLKTTCMHWQQCLADSLSQNLQLLFSRHAGVPGRLAFPFLLLFEVIGPLIECLIYMLLIVGLLCGMVSWPACYAFLSVIIGLGILLSASGLLLEEMSFQPYPKTLDIVILMLVAVLSNLGYRQLNSVWRSIAVLGWITKRKRGALPDYIRPRPLSSSDQ